MGIKDLYPTLRELCPNVFTTIKLEQLNGARVAVDISIFLYKFIKTAEQGKWINFYIRFLCAFRKHNVKFICIFDGANCPQEKREEQNRRRAETQRSVSKMQIANEYYEALKIHNEILAEKFYASTTSTSSKTSTEETEGDNFKYEIDDELIHNIKVLLKEEISEPPLTLGDSSSTSKYDAVVNRFSLLKMEQDLKKIIDRLEKQTSPITKDHSEAALEITKILGIPCFQADGEAEGLCAFLCKHGIVDMVLSEDTDVLAYGTPCFLSKLDLKEETVMLTSFDDVLASLNFTEAQFRDLCIMLGCDYNDRVKGIPPPPPSSATLKTHGPDYKGCTKHPSHTTAKKSTSIGSKAAVCMIDVYRSLEEVEKHCIDIEKLNYKRCREIFEMKDIGNIDPSFFSAEPKEVQRQRLNDFLEKNEVYISKNHIYKIFNC